jgi:hypothetical protein
VDNLVTQINNHSVFFIDKEKEFELYIIEERKFLDILMEYIKNRRYFVSFSWVFFETAKNCLKSYKRETEAFLKYFEVALKKNLKKAMAIENKQKNKWKEKDPYNLNQLIGKYKECTNTDIEQISDENENNTDFKIDSRKYFELIEKEFQNCQERQKIILRDLLSIHFRKENINLDREYMFINMELFKSENLPEEKEIGAKYGKSKESIGRTKMDFLKKVQEIWKTDTKKC